MRNTKKLIAVIMTVAILASMMVPALAASYQTEAEKLMAVGLMQGTDNGVDLELSLDRIQGLTFTVRAMGAEEAALAMTEAEIAAVLETVTDADTIPIWGRAYAAYAVKEGITVGVSTNVFVFAPYAKLSGTQFITMMLRVLGYTGVTLDNCLEKAIAAKMLTAGEAVKFGQKDQLIRDDAAFIIYNTANSGLVAKADGVTASDMTLIGKLVADGAVSATAAAANFTYTVPVGTEITFTAVALNTVQFKLTFSQALNADDAVKEDFYGIKDKTVGDAALQADGTVILTITNYEPFGNNSKAEITLKKNIRNTAGVKLAADYTVKDIPVFDTSFPTFDSVEATGLKNLRLHYSEPVWTGDAIAPDNTMTTDGAIAVPSNFFEVKNDTYTWAIISAKVNVLKGYVDLTLGTNLVEGGVNVKTMNTLKDFAGNLVPEKTIAYTFVKDATAPVASIKSANQNEVVVKFNKPVYGDLKVAHSNKSAYYAVKVIQESAAADEFTFVFAGAGYEGAEAYPLPSGNVTIYVMPNTDKDVFDLYGNKLVETVLTSAVNVDTTAPVVSSYELNDNVDLKVTFDEKIDEATAEDSDSYTLKKADGTTVYFTATLDTTGKILTIDPVANFEDLATYTLTIKKVKDLAGNINAQDIVVTFTVKDHTGPTVTDGTFAVYSGAKIYVYFSEAMSATELLKKSNYLVSKDGGATYAVPGDDDKLSQVSEKVLLIDMTGDFTSNPWVKISTNVSDLAGKKLPVTAGFTYQPVELQNIGTENFAISKVEATAKDKLKVTFTKEIATVDYRDFTVTASGAAVAIGGVSTISGKEVVFNLTSAQTLDTAALVNGADVSVDRTPGWTYATKSVYGTLIGATVGTAGDVVDKIAPTVDKYSFAVGHINRAYDGKYKVLVVPTGGTYSTVTGVAQEDATINIVITLTEAMDVLSFSNLTYTVSGYDVDFVNAVGNTVTISATCKADNTTLRPSVTQVYNVKDSGGNILSGATYGAIILN